MLKKTELYGLIFIMVIILIINQAKIGATNLSGKLFPAKKSFKNTTKKTNSIKDSGINISRPTLFNVLNLQLNGVLRIISNIKVAGGKFSWNGQTIHAGENIFLSIGEKIINSNLTYIPTISDGMYAFIGFTDENNLPINSVNEIIGVKTIKANFQPLYFSKNYGEKWLRIASTGDENLVWELDNNTSEYNGTTPIINKLHFANQSSLWCLVGTADNFKIYNKVLGPTYALTYNTELDPVFKIVDSANFWTMSSKYTGLTIYPRNKDESFSLSSPNGLNPGNTLGYFSATNPVSHWIIKDASINATLKINLANLPNNLPSTQRDFFRLPFSIDSLSTKIQIQAKSHDSIQLFLPRWLTAKLDMPEMERTYKLRNFTINNKIITQPQFIDANITNLQIQLDGSYEDTHAHKLFASPDSIKNWPFRIPALTQAFNGDLIAISDYRPDRNDIGYNGTGLRIDLVGKISRDNGLTWSNTLMIAQHSDSDPHKFAYGDAAICADRESNKVIILAAAGSSGFFHSNLKNPLRIVKINGDYDNKKQQWIWAEPVDITDYIYKEILKSQEKSLFVASGKLYQSRVVKQGDYYRIYAVLICRPVFTNTWRNRVIFSDDFGKTWKHLGDMRFNNYLTSANEAKCEELTDGTIIISSRAYNQRRMNVFIYGPRDIDIAEGHGNWGTESTYLHDHGNNASNGEIYFIHATNKVTNKMVQLILQTVPTGNGRNNVSLFYKEINEDELCVGNVGNASSWRKTQLSSYSSAYSTLELQNNGQFGFFIEENYDGYGGYDMNYFSRSLEELTNNQYTLDIAINLDKTGQTNFISAFPVKLPKDIEVYVASDGKHTLRRLNTRHLAANTEVVLKGKANATYYYQETRNANYNIIFME